MRPRCRRSSSLLLFKVLQRREDQLDSGRRGVDLPERCRVVASRNTQLNYAISNRGDFGNRVSSSFSVSSHMQKCAVLSLAACCRKRLFKAHDSPRSTVQSDSALVVETVQPCCTAAGCASYARFAAAQAEAGARQATPKSKSAKHSLKPPEPPCAWYERNVPGA